MSFITSGLTTAIIVGVVSTVPLLIKRNSRTGKTQKNDKGEKSVDLFKPIFWIFYPICAAFMVLGLYVTISENELVAGIILLSIGAILLIPFIILHLSKTSVDWTSEFIVGAKSGVSIKRHKILWRDTVSAKYHANHTMEIKDKFGKKVFCSVYHKGWPEIIEDLRRIRPDIDTSDFD